MLKIKKSTTLLISLFLFNSVAFADDVTTANSQYLANGTDLTNVTNLEVLEQPFVTRKKMYQITDATAILKTFNLNLIITGKSGIKSPSEGVMIVSNGSLKDYLNLIGNKFNYSNWILQSNDIIFTPDVPYVEPIKPQSKPVVAAVTPVAITSATVSSTAATSANKQVVNITDNVNNTSPVVKKTESSNVIDSEPKNPTQPIISKTSTKDINSINSNNNVWEISTNDKTIKKTLQKWSNNSGWQLIWKSNVDFPITANAKITGSYQDAIIEVCRSSQLTGAKIEAVFHPKNNVVVIQTQDL